MKTYFLTLLLSSFIFVSVSGQNKEKKQTTQDLLMSCVWENLPENSEHIYVQTDKRFDRDSVYMYSYYICYTDNSMKKYSTPSDCLYYFSNTPDKVFDLSKVGKSTDGKYIIEDSLFDPIIHEILKISDKRIDLKKTRQNKVPFSYALTFKSEQHGLRDEKVTPNDCKKWCCLPATP